MPLFAAGGLEFHRHGHIGYRSTVERHPSGNGRRLTEDHSRGDSDGDDRFGRGEGLRVAPDAWPLSGVLTTDGPEGSSIQSVLTDQLCAGEHTVGPNEVDLALGLACLRCSRRVGPVHILRVTERTLLTHRIPADIRLGQAVALE